MAHELELNEATGTGSMFYRKAGGTPWHQWGFEVPDGAPITSEQAVVLAKADWDAILRPVSMVNADGSVVASPVGMILVRSDSGQELFSASDIIAMVGRDYEPFQHRDVFRIMDPLVESGLAVIETGGTVRNGRDAWLLVRFNIQAPQVAEMFGGDVITPYGIVTNNHGGLRQGEVAWTRVRAICANTLDAVRTGYRDADVVKVPHRKGGMVKLIEAANELFGAAIERHHVAMAKYAEMKQTIITVEQFTTHILDVAAPLPRKAFTPDGQHLTTRGYDAAFEAAEGRRKAITEAWHGGIGHTGDSSLWEAWNGLVEVMDHDVTSFRTRGSRVASMLGGRLAELKAKASASAMALVRASKR